MAIFGRNGFVRPIFENPRFAPLIACFRKVNAEIQKRLDGKGGFLEKIRAGTAAE